MIIIPRRQEHRPRTTVSLNGIWELEPGNDPTFPSAFTHTVPVPALVDCSSPRYEWSRWKYHWYRTEFGLEGRSPSDAVLLRLDRAQYGTEVWLNGQHIGGSVACYTAQEYALNLNDDQSEPALLTVRVGSKDTLPEESAVGRDQEKDTFIPGIWGDSAIIVTGRVRIRHTQVIPRLRSGIAETRVHLENLNPRPHRVEVHGRVFEKRTHAESSTQVSRVVEIGGGAQSVVVLEIPVAAIRPWSPADPFLYQVEVRLESESTVCDRTLTTFGMREFTIEGSEFRLNGKRIFLRGGNIAFHRFLSDPDRGLLPWDTSWIRSVLAELPKAHHFNFFRFHLGRAYEPWYDLADEYGIMIQDEWPFWGVTGSREQILREFTQWIRDGCNHPSIVIWDPLNESSDAMVQNDIVPKVRQLDPTRPWESVDFLEQHPYIYSLAEVVNIRPVGFAKALPAIEELATPSVVNEFLWWWLDSEGNPTSLMKGVVERWLGPRVTKEDLSAHQQFLAQELVELFRRMGVDAIQPFVYLSNNRGPTGNWFHGPIERLEPKPILGSLKNAFAPFGISIELWDRHFVNDDEFAVRLFVFNDFAEQRSGVVRLGFTDRSGKLIVQHEQNVSVEASSQVVLSVRLKVPTETGKRKVRGELCEAGSERIAAWSEKAAWCCARVNAVATDPERRIVVLDPSGEVEAYFRRTAAPFVPFEESELRDGDVLLVHLNGYEFPQYTQRRDAVTSFVGRGGVLILQEPEYGVETTRHVSATNDLILRVEKRADVDRGGYDSYVFPDDARHPLWKEIVPGQLAMFNGGVGGEMVSQHDVQSPMPVRVLARCGHHLGVVAVGEVRSGRGVVVFSRIQVRGRLVPGSSSGGLFDRRMDPVAQQYLNNLLGAFR